MFKMSFDDCVTRFNPSNNPYDSDYQFVRILRIIILAISSSALFMNIIIILKKKQYVFPTIKLLLFVEIFYIFSLVSVIAHSADFNLGVFQKIDGQFHDLIQCIVIQGQSFKMAVQGWVNLASYATSYWFAVMITFYIKMVLQDKHKNFIKTNKIRIFGVIFLIALWYFIPFILTLCKDVPFSFGPCGYTYNGNYYFFYSGIVNRYTQTDQQLLGNILVFIWMSFVPFVCFIYHTILLYKNHKHMKELLQSQQQINSRELYTIKSGRLSYLIFIVQLINVGKFILAFYSQQSDIPWLFIFVINTIYDLLGFMLIIIYFVFYYKQGRKIKDESSSIRHSSLMQSLRNDNI